MIDWSRGIIKYFGGYLSMPFRPDLLVEITLSTAKGCGADSVSSYIIYGAKRSVTGGNSLLPPKKCPQTLVLQPFPSKSSSNSIGPSTHSPARIRNNRHKAYKYGVSVNIAIDLHSGLWACNSIKSGYNKSQI